MSDQPHILVVDDHRDIRDLLGRYLRQHEYRVTLASDGRELRKLMADNIAPDLIVLDLMMPGEDGLSLCRWLRENYDVPVVMLTALGEETDRIIGLEMGADDYLAKPFNPRELLARIKAVLRRMPEPQAAAPTDRRRFAGWTHDPATRTLGHDDGRAVELTSGENRLLAIFTDHPLSVLSRARLLDLTAGRDAKAYDRAIDNAVSRLRRKIEDDPAAPVLIVTEWGGGYMLAAEVTPA